MERSLFFTLLGAWAALGWIIFLVLLFISAPYGRHTREGWGLTIPNRWGWFLMEFPALLVFTFFFLSGEDRIPPVTWIFFAAYVGHYLYRSLVYPWRTRTRGKRMPLLVALMAVVFNLVNGYFNGRYFAAFAPDYPTGWLTDPRFIAGLLMFAGGVWINQRADQRLLSLRRGGKRGYQIPRGGMFRWVSCPNFLGECIEWTGFAVMSWSPAAAVFALWTCFNLVPRALDHHRWYRATFPDYPAQRKAIIPGIL